MNKVIVFTIISLFYFVSRATELAVPARIEISKADSYTLADIVEVKEPTIEFMRTLRFEKIALSESMTLEDLRKIVRESRMQNGIFRSAQWKLPSSFRVVIKEGFSELHFQRLVMNEMSVQCPDCQFEFKSMNAINKKIAANWQIDNSALKLQNSQLVQVNDGAGQVVWIPINVRIYRQALVLNKTIPLGTRITESDLQKKQVELGYIKELPLQSLDKIEGLAVRTLTAGNLLMASDFKKEPEAKKGQVVQLTSGTEDFEIRISAIAEENGSLGDVIRVKSADNSKILSAVVTGKNEVRLQ